MHPQLLLLLVKEVARLLCVLCCLSFSLLYAAWLARFGSGLFMVVQMIILLDMTQNWNDDWVSKEDDRSASHISQIMVPLIVSLHCYIT